MNLLEWARRRACGIQVPLLDLLQHEEPRTVSARSGVPLAWVEGVRTFYDRLHGARESEVCTGTACHFERGATLPEGPFADVHCLGRCYEAPADATVAARPIPRASLVDPPVVLRHVLYRDTDPLEDYALPGGDEILDVLILSGLRGRGGAAYPTGLKWKVARETSAPDRFVVANGDEGDPGAYVDRLLLEESPHAVLAGMKACARAIGASRGIVFIRGEYADAAARVEAAIADAEERGLLEGFSVRVVRGAGSYVAGEETALLRAIEGLRAEPSPKPPYPAECGLMGVPTVVQNVETLAVVPWVVRHRGCAGTKAICLSGAIARPCVTEVELGLPLAEVLERAGGGPATGRSWKMALVGGPMGRVVPAREFEVPLSYETLPGMGHGGVVVLDESVSARTLAEHLFRFAALESCGSCTPCRIGSVQLSQMQDAPSLERLLRTMEIGSLCGFGQGVPRPLRDLLRAFPGELFP
jgi:NADH:ubiquinone oxidoreductase subunit F (NADH-binding)